MSLRDDVKPPENIPRYQWVAANCALSAATILVRKNRDSEPEPLLSYLYRAVYWDLRGRDDFDIAKAGKDRDGLRDRARDIADRTLRALLSDYTESILAAIEAERRSQALDELQRAGQLCDNDDAIRAAERERLAKLAEGMDIPTGMSGRAVCTVPGKPIADWIRSQGNEDG